MAAQREAIARAYQAPPAPEPEPEETDPDQEETDLERWSDVLRALSCNAASQLLTGTESVRILERQVIATVGPEVIGPAYLWEGPDYSYGYSLASALAEHLGRKVTILPTSHLTPCPRGAERKSLSWWQRSRDQLHLDHAEAATVARVYRLVFNAYPFRPKQTNAYSRRELELLGL